MMADDKVLACLLSDNGYSKDGCNHDASSPTCKTISCDKNGNFDESNEEYIIDKDARRLSVSSVESSSENPIEIPRDSDTEAEIICTKGTVVNGEVDNASNSTGMETKLKHGDSKDIVMYATETSHVETTTVLSNLREQQHSIEIKAADTLPPQQSQDVSESQHVQQLLDTVMETSHVDTSTVLARVPEQQNSIEIKAMDTLPPQNYQNVSDNQQVQQLLDSVSYTIKTPSVENSAVVPEQHTEIEMHPINSISSQQSQDTLDNLQVQQPQTKSDENCLKYREDVDSSDDDTSSTFSLSSSSDCSDSFLEKMHRSCSPGNKVPNIKTKGELDLDELPPIEDLTIDITEREMQKVGTIYAVVDKLVIVRALKDLQPLDLDSVLFLSHKETLGRIFDVFGPVVEPFYSVRFNSPEHIAEKPIVIDADVFFAPEKTDITSYVFVDQLRKQKGSDASWQDNNEPPEEYIDYSDDDEERAAKRKREAKNRNRYQDSDVQVIPNKVSKDTTRKNSDEINPWVDIQKYQLSLSNTPNPSQKNPFRRPYKVSQAYNSIHLTKPPVALPMPSENYVNPGQERYGTMASQGGTSVSMSFQRPQIVPAPQQHMQLQYPPQPTALQLGPVVVPSTYFSPQHQQFAIQPRPVSPYPQPMVPTLQQPTMNFMHQPPMSPHPGMAPSHRFGHPPYFNNSLPSPMGMLPPPPASPVAFAYRADAKTFLNQPGNFANQAPHFLNRAMSQPANFVSQPSTLHQNPLLGQPGRLQWQNGPPSPYAMSPLSISIPNTPPSNALYTPVPSPYNMWGSKSLNFPQSGYFGNNTQ